MHLIGLFLSILGFLTLPGHAGGERGLLWRVVQACVLNHKITGASFPCLSVDASDGVEFGYAVIRPPDQGARIIITPTVRTIGVEATRLRGSGAPNYFNDAWTARHFVTQDLRKAANRSDIGLAVNSRLGRSQDQLHIHVGCVRRDVKQTLENMNVQIREHGWMRIGILPGAPHYWAHFEPGTDLSKVNVFDRAAYGLKLEPRRMDDATIVVIGAQPSGFFILTRKRIVHSVDAPHGEALLDSDCGPFKAR